MQKVAGGQEMRVKLGVSQGVQNWSKQLTLYFNMYHLRRELDGSEGSADSNAAWG